MILVNRKRINKFEKDTDNYWYVEKYVYGVLKEVLEIPLGTSTTFTSIASGYSDDTFYGWSVGSTVASRTFTNTASYSNTTTAVKNNLDEYNTLKIYAVYGYTTYGSMSSGGAYSSTAYHINTYNFYVHNDATFTFKGNRVKSGGNISGSYSYSYGIDVVISGNTRSSITTNSDGTTVSSIIIKSGSHIEFSLDGSIYSSSSGGYGNTSKLTISVSTASYSTYSISYRVTSHS